MNKVLIVSYNFPPVGGAGVQRPVKFVKYLKDFGWYPIVLTVANPSVPVIDRTFIKDIPDDVKIYRAKTFEPSYALKKNFKNSEFKYNEKIKTIIKRIVSNLALPDLQILWWPGLIAKLIVIIIQENPKIIFVSGPPFSSFIPVVAIAKLFCVPAILDYRDEWAFSREHWENQNNSFIARKCDKILENYVLLRCNAFVAANQSYVDSICKKYTKINKYKGYVITNGYDSDDYAHASDAPISNTIKIVYAGTVWKATSLKNFFAAMDIVLDNDKFSEVAKSVSLQIYGRILDEEMDYVENNKHKKLITVYGYVEHSKIMMKIISADILLLTLSDVRGSEKIITGKVFEYMATGKYIFAVVPNGETKNILEQNYDHVSFADPNNVEEIAIELKKLILTIEQIRKGRGKEIPQFSRKILTQKLSGIFNVVMEDNIVEKNDGNHHITE